MLLFAVGLAGMLYLGLTAQPTSTVVLLPDADGGAGALEVRTEGANQSLTAPYASAHVTNRGAIIARVEDASQVDQRYARTIAALPRAPVSFVLIFEFGSGVDISPAFMPVLDQLMGALASYPAPEITVIGHTDRVGALADNDRLSIQRAETVRKLLQEAGIPASMISIAGRGEREPAVATADEVPQAENRRVEINLR